MLERLLAERAVIMGAPFSALIILVVGMALGFGAAKWGYERELAAVRAEKALADQRPTVPTPRRLGTAQASKFMGILATAPNEVMILHDDGILDAALYASDFERAFTNAGWKVEAGIAFGLWEPPLTGISLRVVNPQMLDKREALIRSALDVAKIPYDLQRGHGPFPSMLMIGKPPP